VQIIPDLTSLIGKSEPLDEYGLEHALALLMTLSLRTSGKRACEAAPDAVLDALMERLESTSPQVSGPAEYRRVSDGSQNFVFLLVCAIVRFVLV
jgi:hypothetical protein